METGRMAETILQRLFTDGYCLSLLSQILQISTNLFRAKSWANRLHNTYRA